MKLASFSSRLIALFLDCLLIGLLAKILPINAIYYDILPYSYENTIMESLANLEGLILSPLYFVGFRFINKGQTLGKKVLNIRTISADNKKLSLMQSMTDCLGYYMLPLDCILGICFSAREQRLTQICSGTIVIEE